MEASPGKPATSPARAEYGQRLGEKSMAPLWNVLGEIVAARPRPLAVPAMWPYAEARPLLMEAGQIITAEEAERRVLILENPGLRGQSRATESVYAGLQLVMPGEIAPTHRHVASAIRLVIESDGGYTAVDGERTTMHPGDLILTPSWTYHDHGNTGEGPAIWLDGLDIPMVNYFNSSFAERYPGGDVQPVLRAEGDSRDSSPAFRYPYSRSRETLIRLSRDGAAHPSHGVRMQYRNPATGGYALATLAAFLQLLPTGFRGAAYRSTESTVYCVVEGRGTSRVGDQAFAWQKHDVFVVPSWCPVSHDADAESVLFSFSDRPAQKALGLWREETAG